MSLNRAIARTAFGLLAIQPEGSVTIGMKKQHVTIRHNDGQFNIVVKNYPFRRNTDQMPSPDRDAPLAEYHGSVASAAELWLVTALDEKFAGTTLQIEHLYCGNGLTGFARKNIASPVAVVTPDPWWRVLWESTLSSLASFAGFALEEDLELKSYLESMLQSALDWGKSTSLPRQIDLSIYPDRISPVYVSLRFTPGGSLKRIVIEDYNQTPERVSYANVIRREDAVQQVVDYMLRHHSFAFDSTRSYFFYEALVASHCSPDPVMAAGRGTGAYWALTAGDGGWPPEGFPGDFLVRAPAD